jgi:hypothetical protein
MKYFALPLIATVLSLLFTISCQSSSNASDDSSTSTENSTVLNQLTEQEIAEGWQLLFDGSSTDGWSTYGQDTIGAAWKVSEGLLYLDASQKNDWQTVGGGDIITDQEFDDFHLKLEWKIAENGNSGIMFHVQEDFQFPYPWLTGPEMQILHNEGHPDGKIEKHRAGDLYDLVACSEESVAPVGEWNLAEIIIENETLTFKLNSVTVVQTILWDDSWKALIAGSKFKDMPSFGTFKSGKIALQDHGDDVWFRNIKIRRL